MNKLGKAAAFGAIMGKRAGLLKAADAALAPGGVGDFPGSITDTNRRSAESQAKWAPANAATNARLKANEAQRYAALPPEAQGAETQAKRDTYEGNINQQLSQGHGLEGASSDFADVIPAVQAAKWMGKGLYSGANALTAAAIKSPITPRYIKNTFYPGYPAVRGALENTSRVYGAGTPGFDPMKTLGPDDRFKGLIANSRRGAIKPPTPPMPSRQASPKPLTGEVLYRSPSPANDAMQQYGYENPMKTMKPHMFDHLNPPGPRSTGRPPLGKPFTRLPNQ